MRLVMVTLIVLALAGLVLVLVGCAAEDRAAAERLAMEQGLARARAEEVRARGEAEALKEEAEAEAYELRTRANSEAEAQRAVIRQAERDAAHERALETLPILAISGGGVVVLVVAALIFWDLRARRPATDPALLIYLDRLRLDSVAGDRELWHAIGELDRRALPSGYSRGEVIIWPDHR